MSIYGVGNLKGGVGKTTTAINLVVALAKRGRDVLLVDAENTAMEFTELRESILGKDNVGYTAIELHGAAILTQVRALTSKYADIVIDIGGEDASGSLRAALTVVEMLAVPVNPRSFDLWRTEATGELVTEAREINDKLRAVAFLNEADPSGPENNETLERLAKIEAFEVAPLMIGRRKAIPRAQARGLSIFEFHEDPKATQEFSQLVDFLAESNVHTMYSGAKSHGNR